MTLYEIVLVAVSASFVCWLWFSLLVNLQSTNKLDRKADSIQEFLAPLNYKLFAVKTHRDASPSEIRFAVLPAGSEPPIAGLSSTKVWRSLQRVKQSKPGALKQLVSLCVKAEQEARAKRAKQAQF